MVFEDTNLVESAFINSLKTLTEEECSFPAEMVPVRKNNRLNKYIVKYTDLKRFMNFNEETDAFDAINDIKIANGIVDDTSDSSDNMAVEFNDDLVKDVDTNELYDTKFTTDLPDDINQDVHCCEENGIMIVRSKAKESLSDLLEYFAVYDSVNGTSILESSINDDVKSLMEESEEEENKKIAKGIDMTAKYGDHLGKLASSDKIIDKIKRFIEAIKVNASKGVNWLRLKLQALKGKAAKWEEKAKGSSNPICKHVLSLLAGAIKWVSEKLEHLAEKGSKRGVYSNNAKQFMKNGKMTDKGMSIDLNNLRGQFRKDANVYKRNENNKEGY